MANYTPNYRLHQWEPEDKFLRTDFNEDFASLDTALGRTARQGADTAYNLYDLFLRAGLEAVSYTHLRWYSPGCGSGWPPPRRR